MPASKAAEAYKSKRHNCAQSVPIGFQGLLDVPDDCLRAPDGLCGALRAALALAPAEAARGRVRERSVSAAGSDKGREVRRAAGISCEECVSLAARLLHEEMDGGQARGASAAPAARGEAAHADRS